MTVSNALRSSPALENRTAIQVRNLYKHYGKTSAIQGITLNVQRGELFGLIGADGAGKTTTFNILGGVIEATAGDEIRRTQQGNNNAYCQDNEISWFDWQLVEKNHNLFRFVQQMIAFRKRHPILQSGRFFSAELNEGSLADIVWHGCRLLNPGWFDSASHVLAFTLGGASGDADIHVMLNMDSMDLDFEIPQISDREWYAAIDTALPSPANIVEPEKETLISSPTRLVRSHSIQVLISKSRVTP